MSSVHSHDGFVVAGADDLVSELLVTVGGSDQVEDGVVIRHVQCPGRGGERGQAR